MEHLCQWHHSLKRPGRGRDSSQFEEEDNGVISSNRNTIPIDLRPPSNASPSVSAASVAAAAAVAATGGSFSSREEDDDEEGDNDDREETLEVEQVLMRELQDELAQERSLNVTALLLVDKDTLAPGVGYR